MTRALWALVAIGAAVATGCAGPDLRRGKAELEAGELEHAEADLKPLADMGYPEAKVALARVYAKSTDPVQVEEGIKLYQEMLKEDPTVAVPLARLLIGSDNPQAVDRAQNVLEQAAANKDERALVPLLELYSDHPERDPKNRARELAPQVARLKTPDAELAIVKWYRRNVAVDAKYQNELVKRCEIARDRIPECYVDLARHYRIIGADAKLKELADAAMARGQLPTTVLERLAWSLVSDDYPGQPRPEAAYPMLKRASANSTVARVRMARLLIEYPQLDPEAKPEQLLLKAAEQGYPEASLALGRLYLDGKLAVADPARAEKYFLQAAEREPAAHYYLGRIYKRGLLGRTEPVKAAQHYLIAARNGFARADAALALLYSDNRGVKPNLPNAFAFASLAAQTPLPEAKPLLSQIKSAMKPSQIQEGQRVLQAELAARQAAPPAPQQAVPPASRQGPIQTQPYQSPAESQP